MINIANNELEQAYVGSTPVDSIYLGEQKVWPEETTPTYYVQLFTDYTLYYSADSGMFPNSELLTGDPIISLDDTTTTNIYVWTGLLIPSMEEFLKVGFYGYGLPTSYSYENSNDDVIDLGISTDSVTNSEPGEFTLLPKFMGSYGVDGTKEELTALMNDNKDHLAATLTVTTPDEKRVRLHIYYFDN